MSPDADELCTFKNECFNKVFDCYIREYLSKLSGQDIYVPHQQNCSVHYINRAYGVFPTIMVPYSFINVSDKYLRMLLATKITLTKKRKSL